jgi:hypothetical protein
MMQNADFADFADSLVPPRRYEAECNVGCSS